MTDVMVIEARMLIPLEPGQPSAQLDLVKDMLSRIEQIVREKEGALFAVDEMHWEITGRSQ
jgi:hypothetical protein